MADIATAAGSRDDLTVDTSRCLCVRFCESSCRRCLDSCPHGAVSLVSGLTINPETCRACLLCTANCPSGALEHVSDFSDCLAQLSRVPEPVLGCARTREHSHASLACLGGLSEEHLLTLCNSFTARLTLNLSLCSDCINSSMIPFLRERLTALSGSLFTETGCRMTLAESTADVLYRSETINRRGFFASFRTALFQSTAVLISPAAGKILRHTPYGEKRLPARRILLTRIRAGAKEEQAARLKLFFDSQALFNDSCTACQACVAICPTGALQTNQSDTSPAFDHLFCTGCGLCAEFCQENALQIERNINPEQNVKKPVIIW